jgi:hypothetical protein
MMSHGAPLSLESTIFTFHQMDIPYQEAHILYLSELDHLHLLTALLMVLVFLEFKVTNRWFKYI